MKCFGIVQVEVYVPSINEDVVSIKTEMRYYGGICMLINNVKQICTPYIGAFKQAFFISYDKINMIYGNEENIIWENEFNELIVYEKSKLWDHTIFTPISVKKLNFLNKDSNIKPKHSDQLSIYGIDDQINQLSCININLVHIKLSEHKFYQINKITSYPGSLVYMNDINDNNKIKFVGITSYSTTKHTRIIPMMYFYYKSIYINFAYNCYKIDDKLLADVNLLHMTLYPKLLSNFKKFRKNDTIVEINNSPIFNCLIFNEQINDYVNINSHLFYLCQINKSILFTIVRNNKILYVDFESQKLNMPLKNKVETYKKNDYRTFSSDLCDYILQQKSCVNNESRMIISKYLTNPYYKVKLKFFLSQSNNDHNKF